MQSTSNQGFKMKICSKCKIEKSVVEFHKDKSRKDGLNNTCKMCVIENVKRWRQANPEKKREHDKKYKQANPEKVKRWYQANPEKVRESIKRWQQANPEKMREISKIRWAIKKQSGL